MLLHLLGKRQALDEEAAKTDAPFGEDRRDRLLQSSRKRRLVRREIDEGRGAAAEARRDGGGDGGAKLRLDRSEEHTSELQSLMRISYAVFCLKKKIYHRKQTHHR